jgi:hypothetical protein
MLIVTQANAIKVQHDERGSERPPLPRHLGSIKAISAVCTAGADHPIARSRPAAMPHGLTL